MKTARLNRLLGADGRCLDVAVDHGVFNVAHFLDGLGDMPAVVRSLVEAAPDAIQMNPGQADLLSAYPRATRPALVLRLDIANVYYAERVPPLWDRLQNPDEPVIAALRADAAAVVANLIHIPGESDLHRQCVENIGRLRTACDHYGMPLMVETLVMKPGPEGGYGVDGDADRLTALVRQARDLGADLVKADPTDHAEDYARVIEAARCPVLVRGGGRVDLKTVFERSYAFLQQGAAGLVYGRNVYQHPDPARVVAGLMAMIHEDATPEQAFAIGGSC